jgi:AcrR family transcriptional regulator
MHPYIMFDVTYPYCCHSLCFMVTIVAEDALRCKGGLSELMRRSPVRHTRYVICRFTACPGRMAEQAAQLPTGCRRSAAGNFGNFGNFYSFRLTETPLVRIPKPEMEHERRNRILDQVEPLFLTMGFSRVTTDEIAASVGMSKKTVYQEFGSKQELVRAVVRRKLARIEDQLARLDETASTGSFDPLTDHMMLVSRELYGVSRPFLTDLARHAPELWDEMQAFRREQVFGRLQDRVAPCPGTGNGAERREATSGCRNGPGDRRAAAYARRTHGTRGRPRELVENVRIVLTEGVLVKEERR